MTSAEFKELSDNIIESKKVMGEMRADFEKFKSYKKDMENLAADYKNMKDAIAELQSKTAMQTTGATAEPEYKKALIEFARKGVAINNTVVGPQGGFLVPEVLYNQIMLKAAEDNVIRQSAEILSTTSGSLDLPIEVNDDTVEMIGELEAKPKSEVHFQRLHINIFDFARTVPVTTQLIDDSQFPIEQYIVGHIGRRIAVAEENSFLNGESPKQPEGILKAAGIANVTAASATAITLDELVDMRTKDGVAKTSVLAKSSYLMHPATFQAIAKLKDTVNRPLYLPIGDRIAPSIQGFEVKLSTAMPKMTTGNKSVVFGDFSAYKIVDRKDMEILRNPYKEPGQVHFQFTKRVGGAVGDRDKLVTLTQA